MYEQNTKLKELKNKENPKKAFSYLAQKAREAHLNGDGILVNHICSLALSKTFRIIASSPG